jgi:hypothetical protein
LSTGFFPFLEEGLPLVSGDVTRTMGCAGFGSAAGTSAGFAGPAAGAGGFPAASFADAACWAGTSCPKQIAAASPKYNAKAQRPVFPERLRSRMSFIIVSSSRVPVDSKEYFRLEFGRSSVCHVTTCPRVPEDPDYQWGYHHTKGIE